MRPLAEDPQELGPARRALAAAAGEDPGCWLVGGAVRDALLGLRAVKDLDLATAEDPRKLARSIAHALDAPMFSLSDRFGGYRVTAAAGVQIDVMPLTGETIEADLARRDLTVNALAASVASAAESWPTLDPDAVLDTTGGLADLSALTLRAAGPQALADDPLRVLRIARMAAGGRWKVDGPTAVQAREAAPGLGSVPGERSGEELRLLLGAAQPRRGLAVLRQLGGLTALLPELAALDGVAQSPYHHRDVGGHTDEVLACQIDLERRLDAYVDPASAQAYSAILAEEVAGGWTIRHTLRLAALLHDIAKPQTRTWYAERGIIGFPNHDREGQRLAAAIGRRLRLPRRVIDTLGALTRHHLRLGYLVHARPLDRGEVYDYLHRTGSVAVEVTVLALADRLATRGKGAERAIELHAALTRELLREAVAWRAGGGAPSPLIDGNQLVQRTGREPGAWVAAALEAQRRARFIDPMLSKSQALGIALDAGAAA